MKRNILDLSIKELHDWATEQGLKKYSAGQLVEWLYHKKVTSFDEMTNLSKQTKALLEENFFIRYLEYPIGIF